MRVADPGELKRAVPEAVFAAWRVYFAREPTAGERLDWFLSRVLAWCYSWSGPPPPADALVPWGWPKPRPAPAELGERLRAWAVSHQSAGEK